jgi:hypothetical protein
MVALLVLVHLWIPFTSFVFGGAGIADQGGINDLAMAHGHALSAKMGLNRLGDLLLQVVLLEQMPEAENRCLIRDPLAATPMTTYPTRRISWTVVANAALQDCLRLLLQDGNCRGAGHFAATEPWLGLLVDDISGGFTSTLNFLATTYS